MEGGPTLAVQACPQNLNLRPEAAALEHGRAMLNGGTAKNLAVTDSGYGADPIGACLGSTAPAHE